MKSNRNSSPIFKYALIKDGVLIRRGVKWYNLKRHVENLWHVTNHELPYEEFNKEYLIVPIGRISEYIKA